MSEIRSAEGGCHAGAALSTCDIVVIPSKSCLLAIHPPALCSVSPFTEDSFIGARGEPQMFDALWHFFRRRGIQRTSDSARARVASPIPASIYPAVCVGTVRDMQACLSMSLCGGQCMRFPPEKYCASLDMLWRISSHACHDREARSEWRTTSG